MASPASSSLLLLAAAVLLLALPRPSFAYRIRGSADEGRPFVPYERGFVQDAVGGGTVRADRHEYPDWPPPTEGGGGDGDGRICAPGVFGPDCSGCDPLHLRDGGKEDGPCVPRLPCPDGCSGAGECDELTGRCECAAHRTGDSCAETRCSVHHRFCVRCDGDGCLECEEGFGVVPSAAPAAEGGGGQCRPCWEVDPRCRSCGVEGGEGEGEERMVCTSCVDLLLLSTHWSGRRPQDPPLPPDELARELSAAAPFGSASAEAYVDAEHYFLVDEGMRPLNGSAVECHQGLDMDGSATCEPYGLASHVMCGNHGTITFDSPEYAVPEDSGHVRLTARRTGGGVGEVTAGYSVYPIDAGWEDVTATAFYAGNRTVTFREGQIRASFLVAINDDRLLESNETFSVHLSHPTGGARLGTQSRTIVTIVDDDSYRTCAGESKFEIVGGSRDVEAGAPLSVDVTAVSCSGRPQSKGGDVFRLEARRLEGGDGGAAGAGPVVVVGRCEDRNDGTYACSVNATRSGGYDLRVRMLVPGGLEGRYHDDMFLDSPVLARTDAVVNFTWGTGPVTRTGRDHVSVRWEGYVRSDEKGLHTFEVEADDHARLWVDGSLLVDSWSFDGPRSDARADHSLEADGFHPIVMEYRELGGEAAARLLWSSERSARAEVIPTTSLYYGEDVKGCPVPFFVAPSSPSGDRTIARGEGLVRGIAGRMHPFSIAPGDRFGNAIADEELAFETEVVLVDADSKDNRPGHVLVNPAYYNRTTGRYDVSYVPRVAGFYELHVRLRTDGGGSSEPILGSPFGVETMPGETFARESEALGGHGNCGPELAPCPGTDYGVSGHNSTFEIRAYDAHKNRRRVGGEDWKTVVYNPDFPNEYSLGSFVDHGNGLYTAFVAPIRSGRNELLVTLDSVPIKGSPFQMDVSPGEFSQSMSSLG